MSRTRREKTALNPSIMSSLNDAIKKIHKKVSAHNALALTHDDYLNLFVPPGLHIVAQQAPKEFLHYDYSSFTVPWASVELRFELNGASHPMVARKVKLQGDTADPNLVSTIGGWVTQQVSVGYDFGRVKRVLEILNTKCKDAAQVRFFFPGILTLCSVECNDPSVLGAFAESIRAYKTPDKIPVLGPGLLSECQKASGIIAMSQLLSDPADVAAPPFEVALDRVASMHDPVLGPIECLI
jgi:hypothetical protein